MKPTPFNPDTDLATTPFDERNCNLAAELKRAGLPWKTHVGCFVWDRDEYIEAPSPFPRRIYSILNLGHFLKRFETLENVSEKLIWLPTRQQTEKFIHEKIKILDRLMSAGGHLHLILAGNPKMTARVRKALPKHLEAKLIDVVPAGSRDQTSDVVAATIVSFIEREQAEGLQTVESLQHEIDTNGLAVIGQHDILQALEWGQGDILVLSRDYEPEDIREEMVRRAELSGCTVEIVEHSDALMMLGWAGCLLRYKIDSTIEHFRKEENR